MRMGAEENAFFRVSKAVWQRKDQDQGLSFLVSRVSGKVNSEYSSMKRL